MQCVDYRRWLSPYVDERLTSEQRAQLEAHLSGCAGCRGELVSLRQMLQALRTLGSPAVPDLLPGIHGKLQHPPWWRAAVQRFLAPWPAGLPLHGAALAATAMLVIVVVHLSGPVRRDNAAQPLLQLATGRSYHQDALEDKVARMKTIQDARGQRAAVQAERVEADQEAEVAEGFFKDLPVPTSRELDQPRNEVAGQTALMSQHEASGPGAATAVTGLAGPLPANAAQPTPLSVSSVQAPPAASREAPVLLQVRWRVTNVATAMIQVTEWVRAQNGWAVATSDHHLSITLPAAEVPQLLQHFSSEAGQPIAPALPAPGTPSPWVPISLELVPSE